MKHQKIERPKFGHPLEDEDLQTFVFTAPVRGHVTYLVRGKTRKEALANFNAANEFSEAIDSSLYWRGKPHIVLDRPGNELPKKKPTRPAQRTRRKPVRLEK